MPRFNYGDEVISSAPNHTMGLTGKIVSGEFHEEGAVRYLVEFNSPIDTVTLLPTTVLGPDIVERWTWEVLMEHLNTVCDGSKDEEL